MRRAWILLVATLWVLRPTWALAAVRPIEPSESQTQAELITRLESQPAAESPAPLESLTQEQAIERALARHPKIQKAQARVRQAEIHLKDSRRWLKPSVSLYAGQRLEQDRHRVSIQVSQDLDRLWDRSPARQAEAELTIADQDFHLTRQGVVAETVSAHQAWILARSDRQRAERRAEQTRTELEQARKEYEEGLISKSELRKAEQEWDRTQHAQEEASAHLNEAALRLRQAIGEMGIP